MRRWNGVVTAAAVAILLAVVGVRTFGPVGRAQRIAARNTAARGGLGAWRAVKTMRLSGKLEAGVRRDPVRLATTYQNQLLARRSPRPTTPAHDLAPERPLQLPFTLELKRPLQSRLEIPFRGQTAVQVFDGREGWKLRPFLGRREVEPYDADELRLAAQQSDLDGPLIDASVKGSKLELVGTEKVEGKDAYNVKITLKNGEVRHLWVDVHDDLEVKIDGTRRMDGKLRPVWTYFRDYRSVNGLMIPHVLETVVEGVAGSEKIVVEQVALNPDLPDGRFARPDPAAPAAPAAPAPASPPPEGGVEQPRGQGASPQGASPQGAEALARASRSTGDYKLPQVTLLRDDGKSVSLPAELDDGRLVIVNFVFTTCATICPLMSQVFSQLQDRLGPDRDKVHMVSVSLDPEQDRPARLADYAKKFHAGAQWRFYTGTVESSVAVQRAFDAYRGEKMNHTPVTFLRAATGSRWIRIDGFASADELAREVRTLLAAR